MTDELDSFFNKTMRQQIAEQAETRTARQRFYDSHGYNERQADNPGDLSTYLAWAHDFHEDLDRYAGAAPSWLKWIHTYRLVAPEGQWLHDDGWAIQLDPVGCIASDGRRMYAENYFKIVEGSAKLKIRLFLNGDPSYARIECYDPSLAEACEQALAAIA